MPSSAVADTLWQDKAYRRLWSSLLLSGLAGQVGSLSVSLTAAVLLQATPMQIGLLGAMGAMPAVLLMLPSGVWLDRRRKLPAYFGGEALQAAMLACVPIAWMLDRLNVELLYLVAFVGGCVSVVSGTAAQVVLAQVVRRDQLVEAHGKNRVAGAIAETVGPGLAGLLVKLIGAPLAVAVDCVLALGSVAILRGLRVAEPAPQASRGGFWPELMEGIRFVAGDRLLLSMALAVACWQVFQTCAMVTQVLFATRHLGLDGFALGLCLAAGGIGTVAAGSAVHRLSRRVGSGAVLIAGMAVSAVGWLQLAAAPAVGSFIVMQLCFGSSVVLIFSSMLALRQALTPPPMLARMTSTMRWLTLFPAWPGMLLGGMLGEHFGLRAPVAVGGIGALLLALALWRFPVIRGARVAAQTPG